MNDFEFESVIYTDEVEIMANSSNGMGLGLHFNGIYFALDQATNIINALNPVVHKLGNKGFHANRMFKQKTDDNYDLMNYMTDVIINNKIIWINFPFAKETMKSDGLKPFFDMQFTNMNYQKTNYRAVAFFLYFHSIHYYQEKFQIFKPKIRIYADKDEYLKLGSEFQHDGAILYNIERIISTTGKSEPFLYLADLVGFMFGRVKSHIGAEFRDVQNIDVDNLDQLTKICLFNTMRIVQNGLFKLFNFWDIMPRA